MSTTEKMFMQIFDRKRSIIEQMKQHKLRYDECLASKLLIQGITPPNWLLNSEFNPPCSASGSPNHLGNVNPNFAGSPNWLLNSEFNPPCSASELMSGILLSNPAPNDTFAKTCASSNGSQGYKPSIIPSHHIDCTEDVATIVPLCHDNDIQDTLNYVTMSPEDQTDTINPKQEGSLAIIHRSRSRQKALQLRNSGKETAKSCLGKENNDDIPSGNKALGYDEAHDGIRESIDLSRPSVLPTRISQEAELGGYSDKETRVDACSDFSSLSKGNEVREVQTEDEEKMEKQSNVTVGRHTRSRSRCSNSITGEYESNRKSPETYVGRSTRSRSGKAQLPEIEDPLKKPVTSSNSSQVQPIDGYQAIENSQVNSGKITNPRSSGANEATIENRKSRTKDEISVMSKGNEAQEVQTEYEEKMEKQSNVTVGRHKRSRSHCSKSITGEYESNRKSCETYVGRVTRSRTGPQLPEIEDPVEKRVTQSYCSQIQPIDEIQAIKNSQVNSGKITNPRSSGANEATIENRKSRTKAEMYVMSKGNEAQEVQTEYEEKMVKQSNVTVGRHKRSRSHCSKSITGEYESNRKSCETYVGRVTRSRSGPQLPEIEDPVEKRVTQFYCSQFQPIDGIQAIKNSQVNSSRITKPRSGGANEANIENSKRVTNDKMSVKPKQLDFDEGEETCLPDILTEGMGSLKENTKDKPAALPCTFSAERMSEKCKSLAFETHEALEIEVDPSLPISDEISSHTSLLDRGPDSPGTEEHMIGINVEYSADPSLSIPNVNMSAELSSRKRKFEPDEEQKLKKEASYLSLPNTDSEHIMSLHSDAEPALISEKARHGLSSCNDSDKISYVGLSNPDTKATMSLHRDAADATLSPKQNSDVTRSEHPSEVLQPGSQERKAGLQTTSLFSNVEEVGCFELPEVRAGIYVLPEYNVNNALDGSWPCYKRRKIRYQDHSKSASPRVRVNTSLGINENIRNKSMDCEKEYSCISQKLIISKDSGGMFPNPDLVVNTSLGVNGNIRNESMDGKKENSSCISQKLVISRDSDAMFSNPEFVATAAHGIKYLDSEEPELTPKEQHEEGKISLGRSVMMSFTCEEKQFPSRVANLKQDISGEPSDCFSEGKFKEAPTCAVQHSGVLYPDLEFTDVVEGNCTEELIFTKTVLDKYDAVESDPEFESFIIDGKRDSIHNAAYELLNGKIPFLSEIAECTELPEPIHIPTSLSTPSSSFPTVYSPYYTAGVYRSVPNGLIEKFDLARNLLSNDDVFQGKSYPSYAFPSRRTGYDFAKPVISPVGKGFEEIAFKSDSSAKQRSCNPEHICFPIQEDPETSEEDVNVSDIPDTEINGAYSNKRISPIREPLCNITVETSHKVERGSLESETTEISIVEKHKQDTKSDMRQRCIRTRQWKVNQSLSIGTNSIKKYSDSLSSYSQPKLSGKSSLRNREAILSEKEPKRTNIVSNVKSFIPFVRQKQESSCVPGKKEVKVKALEAAEEAKRKEEKKENERKQKREALKLERARSKQENLKQMELKKKLEEVERKRKESENVAKKRQREEEERKDRLKKKQRIEDARCQQKQAVQKIHAWKEQSRSENEDGKAHERKYSNDKVDRAPEKEHTIRNPVNELVGSDGRETDNAPPSTNDNKSCTGSSDTGKVGRADVTDISTPNCDKTDERINQMREQSYDISPYQCSDDEEEEDDMPNKKFIPTWASKSSVSVALSWMKHMDPDTIFSPGRFCSLEEVLLPRRLVQK